MAWMQQIGIGACPVLALIGVRLWMASSGPATAGAATPPEPIVPPKFVALPEMTESQRALIERARSLSAVEPGSPFPRKEVAMIQAPDMPSMPGVPQAAVEPPPELTLTSIMGGRVPVAMVNGRPRSLGDHVAPDWRIVEIGQDKIEVEHADGRRVSVNLQRGTP